MRLRGVWIFYLVMISIITPADVGAQGYSVCGSLENGWGPYDYRVDKDRLGVVEKYHFTPEVAGLIRGASTVKIGADIAYTLRAFPNHHRALMSMMNLARKERNNQPEGSEYTVECWFDRAARFQPDDPMVKVIHGLFLIRSGKSSEALTQLDAARRIDSNDANVNYNLGLAYVELGEYEKARESARRAYAAGFPLQGLQNRLKRAGKW